MTQVIINPGRAVRHNSKRCVEGQVISVNDQDLANLTACGDVSLYVPPQQLEQLGNPTGDTSQAEADQAGSTTGDTSQANADQAGSTTGDTSQAEADQAGSTTGDTSQAEADQAKASQPAAKSAGKGKARA